MSLLRIKNTIVNIRNFISAFQVFIYRIFFNDVALWNFEKKRNETMQMHIVQQQHQFRIAPYLTTWMTMDSFWFQLSSSLCFIVYEWRSSHSGDLFSFHCLPKWKYTISIGEILEKLSELVHLMRKRKRMRPDQCIWRWQMSILILLTFPWCLKLV